MALGAMAQPRPYIGFVYPAGGQQGTTFQIRLGGQALDDVDTVLVTGSGVTARVTENYRRLNTEELELLNEQASVLRRETMSDSGRVQLMESEKPAMMSGTGTNQSAASAEQAVSGGDKEQAAQRLEKIEKR